MQTDAPSLPSNFNREASPSKNVHWGRGNRIISGPTISDPQRHSQSPTRSALRRPAHAHEHGDHDITEDDLDSPSEQLQSDLCQSGSVAPAGGRPSKTAYRARKLLPAIATSCRSTLTDENNTNGLNSRSLSRTDDPDGDQSICEQVNSLKQTNWDFAECFPSRPKKARSDVLSQLLQLQNEHLVRYVGCIAMGGKNGAEGWQKLFTDDVSRKGVVWGVLGRALKENVFDEVYFGAWPELEAKLKQMEREQVSQGGMYDSVVEPRGR